MSPNEVRSVLQSGINVGGQYVKFPMASAIDPSWQAAFKKPIGGGNRVLTRAAQDKGATACSRHLALV